jgi:hypothetical protein
VDRFKSLRERRGVSTSASSVTSARVPSPKHRQRWRTKTADNSVLTLLEVVTRTMIPVSTYLTYIIQLLQLFFHGPQCGKCHHGRGRKAFQLLANWMTIGCWAAFDGLKHAKSLQMDRLFDPYILCFLVVVGWSISTGRKGKKSWGC